jgi:hypothetical protein
VRSGRCCRAPRSRQSHGLNERSPRKRSVHLWCIGMPPPIPIVLAAYNPEWPQIAAAHGDRLRALGSILETVHHIGSTAVPGLAAKPIINSERAGPMTRDAFNQLSRPRLTVPVSPISTRTLSGMPAVTPWRLGDVTCVWCRNTWATAMCTICPAPDYVPTRSSAACQGRERHTSGT